MTSYAPAENPPKRLPSPETERDEALPRKRRAGSRFPLVAYVVSAGLVLFNAWWFWRDHRPVPAIATVNAWISGEEFAKAEAALREHARRAPSDGEVRTLLAKALAGQGDMLGCARELEAVPYWWPTKPEALFHEGQAYLMANRARDAERCWKRLIDDDPLHPTPADTLRDATLLLLDLYATENRWEDAAVVLWHAYENTNAVDHVSLLSMRVRSELERLSPDATLPKLKRYVEADPSDWEALRALARVELALNHREEAERAFQACLKGDPENPRVWRDYLNMLYDVGDQETLARLIEKVPPAAEVEPDVWRLRGLLSEKAGDWEAAARNYRESLERNPYVMASHYRMAMVEERLGRRESANDHRHRADSLRDARGALRAAFNDMVSAHDGQAAQSPKRPDVPTSMRRLASICETLGWTRLAQAWNKLAESS